MRRRSRLWAFLILIMAFAGLITVIGLMLKSEPSYYSEISTDEEDDPIKASTLVTRFGDLQNDIRSKPDWGASFSAVELNAFLRDQLDEGNTLADLLPAGLNCPRVAIEGDRLKLAARMGDGFWSTVLSIEMRAWLVNKKVNTVAVELIGIWAGSVPISSQSILDWITERVRVWNVDVAWYRHNGNPVGLFHFYADQPRPPTYIKTLSLRDAKVTLAGRTTLDQGVAATNLP